MAKACRDEMTESLASASVTALAETVCAEAPAATQATAAAQMILRATFGVRRRRLFIGSGMVKGPGTKRPLPGPGKCCESTAGCLLRADQDLDSAVALHLIVGAQYGR
jgi:hypothetical protein